MADNDTTATGAENNDAATDHAHGAPKDSATPASASTDPTRRAATASPWEELGSFDEVRQRLEHARTWEKRAKENSDAAKRLAEIEDAQKTETQKLNDRLAVAEKELTEHRVREIRVRAAREAGLDPEMAEFLTASDDDAALKQAKTLAKRVQPKPDLRQGARQTTQPKEDVNAWLRRAAGYNR